MALAGGGSGMPTRAFERNDDMKASSVSSRLTRRLQRLAVLAGAAALCGALAVALAGCVGASAGDTAAAGDSAIASGGSGASARG